MPRKREREQVRVAGYTRGDGTRVRGHGRVTPASRVAATRPKKGKNGEKD